MLQGTYLPLHRHRDDCMDQKHRISTKYLDVYASNLFFDAFPQPLEQHLPKLAGGIKKIIGSKSEELI